MAFMGTREIHQNERAAVNYVAPHGMETVILNDGDVAGFGRGMECRIRFGYAPQRDRGLPRMAGRLTVVNHRVFVENAAQAGPRVIEVQKQDGSLTQLAFGEGLSPSDTRFDAYVRGHRTSWKLSVVVRLAFEGTGIVPGVDVPTKPYDLELTDLQSEVLEAYLEPARRGRLDPPVHRDVAVLLGHHPDTVREALYEVWAKMFEQDMPMPDASDKRIAVVEAARVHGLVSWCS